MYFCLQILPVPLDVEVREQRDQETVASALKRMAHKPDWTDKEAETAGPYASRKISLTVVTLLALSALPSTVFSSIKVDVVIYFRDFSPQDPR